MTDIAVPVFSRSVSRTVQPSPAPTRFLYEIPHPRSDDRRRLTLSFVPAYERRKRLVVEATVELINELLILQTNWDCGGAPQVSELAALTAVEWLDLLASADTPLPHVVPLLDGGLQLEWIANGQAFEIEVGVGGDVGVLGVDAAGNVIVEGDYPTLDGTEFVTQARKFLATLF